ncbi:MAG: hypothetical protein KBF73_02360 [Flavobacteriales bacterium]|nr:hypothetical protein [Flavobacteriales bacterium]
MSEYLVIFFSWLVALLAWSPIGLWLLRSIDSQLIDRPVHNFITGTLVGAAINSSFLAILSFWIPITIGVSMVLVFINLLLFNRIFIKEIKQLISEIKGWSRLSIAGLVVFSIISVLCSAHTSLNNDSGLYYIQFMKWINSYPVVPGLANLHDRLGFNSHWHLLNAAFNLNNMGGNTNDLNGLLFILIGLGIFDSASRLAQQMTLFDLIWTIFPVPFFLLLRFLTSSAPDLPATLIPLIYFSILIDRKENSPLPILALLIVFAATIKVMSVLHAIALLPLLFWVIKRDDWKALFTTAILVAFVAVPWLGRNVIQTGYFVFPMESIDLFNFDWKVPNELVASTRKMVDIHARFGNYELTNYGKPMSDWLTDWFGNQSKSVLALLVLVLMSSLIVILTSAHNIIRNTTTQKTFINLFLALTVFVSFAFWWKSGPNPRFIYGVLFFFFSYTIALIMVNFQIGRWLRFVPILSLVPMLVISRTILKETGPARTTEFETIKGENSIIYYPINSDKCWEHDLPCANMNRYDLELREESLEGGFKNSEATN